MPIHNTVTNTRTLPAKHDIHIADNSEIAEVCNILASAFTHDPVLNWLSGQPQIYSSLFRAEAEALYKHHGQVYINREQTGAAMWLPPAISAKCPLHWRLLTAAWHLTVNGGLSGLRRGRMLETLMARHHPREPHFYLHSIGADLENQGRGIGSALIKAGLRACDQQGVMAYLESSNEKNNPLYERHGFAIIGEETLADDGPTLWFMRRAAQ